MTHTNVSIADRLVDKRDLAYIEREKDRQKQTAILCSVTKYRRADRLNVGNPVPAIELVRPDSKERVNLADPSNWPMLLIFGSYT